VTHDATRMASMENPAKGLGEVIRRIDDAWDVAHDNVASLLPVLNSKVLDINVTRTLGRNTSIDHLGSRHVVFVDRSRFVLRETQFGHYITARLGLLSGKDDSEKLSFRRASGSDRLRLGAVRNCTIAESKSVASRRATVAKVIRMSGVHVGDELEWRRSSRYRRKVFWVSQGSICKSRHRWSRDSLSVDNAPVHCR